MKVCSKCGIEKELSEFTHKHRVKNGKDYGYKPYSFCRQCEYDEQKERNRKRMANPEYAEYRKAKVRQHAEKYRQTDKGKLLYEKQNIERKKKRDAIPKSCKIYVKTCEVTGELFISRRKSARIKPDNMLQYKRAYSIKHHADHRQEKRLYNMEYRGCVRIRKCVECNKEYDFLLIGTNKFCSIECRDIHKRRLEHKHKIEYKFTRAGYYYRLKHGTDTTQLYQSIDPYEIFERDKWRCKICNIKTPKKMRGTIAPNAPELDHIVPLSKGGQHTYSNVQCLCRKCNGSKCDKLIGQQVLCI